MLSGFADTLEYEAWQLLGDPELNMWTGVPSHITVLHDPAVQLDQPDLTVTVLNEGAPLSGALVSCVKGDEVYSYGWTGELGHITLPTTPATPGTLLVTVTARNCYPYEGEALVIESGPFVAFSELLIEDGLARVEGGHAKRRCIAVGDHAHQAIAGIEQHELVLSAKVV